MQIQLPSFYIDFIIILIIIIIIIFNNYFNNYKTIFFKKTGSLYNAVPGI